MANVIFGATLDFQEAEPEAVSYFFPGKVWKTIVKRLFRFKQKAEWRLGRVNNKPI